MPDIRNTVPSTQRSHAVLWSPPLPTPRDTFWRLRRVWFVGLFVFGYGPAFTYGWLTWLLNERQWFWTYLMYFTLVPLVGGMCVVFLPCVWYRPIHRALTSWASGVVPTRKDCLRVYETALQLPWRIAVSACAAPVVGYLGGTVVVHWQAQQPVIEMLPKTLPAIPLVGGMMGAFCYFGTARAMQPVLAWCSVQVRHVRPIHHVSLAAKFLATTCVLAVAALCLLQPSAYRFGQVIVEEQLRQRALEQLGQFVEHHPGKGESLTDTLKLLQQVSLGAHGYIFIADARGHIVTPHPQTYTQLSQEQWYQLETHLASPSGSWVDRVGHHRVIAFVRIPAPALTIFSVSWPSDFADPLHQFMLHSWVAILEILFVVLLFGRYYTKSITTPLAELTRAAQRIAESGDLSEHVPVTTNDEVGDVARSFNRMVERLQVSKAELEERTRRLERSTQELSNLNQEMEDLLRVVSHDLRAPLINIQGFSKRLEPLMHDTLQTLDRLTAQSREPELRTQVEALRGGVQTRFLESLRFISKGVEKMDTLLSSLLAISRVGRKADPIQPNDLNHIVDDVLATFDHQLKERAIQVIRHPLPQAVSCRRNEINQVFSNLVSNAINYMGPSEQRFIEIGATESPPHVECYVRDTGIGIASEDQERVFQMFTRLQAIESPGEGIGLAYVRKILHSHGGKLWVSSVRGQGSTFSFTLPMTLPSVGERPEPLVSTRG